MKRKTLFKTFGVLSFLVSLNFIFVYSRSDVDYVALNYGVIDFFMLLAIIALPFICGVLLLEAE